MAQISEVLKLLDLSIEHDKVSIVDYIIKRPSKISPTEWLEFWENAQKDNEVCEEEIDKAREESLEVGEKLGYENGRQEGYEKAIQILKDNAHQMS